MNEAVKALTFEDWHNGQATCCKDCAENCPHIGWERVAWNAGRASVERQQLADAVERDERITQLIEEGVALREPGPCGKHPLACWKQIRSLTIPGESLNAKNGRCSACAEQASLQSRIDEARKVVAGYLEHAYALDPNVLANPIMMEKYRGLKNTLNKVVEELLAVLDRKSEALK